MEATCLHRSKQCPWWRKTSILGFFIGRWRWHSTHWLWVETHVKSRALFYVLYDPDPFYWWLPSFGFTHLQLAVFKLAKYNQSLALVATAQLHRVPRTNNLAVVWCWWFHLLIVTQFKSKNIWIYKFLVPILKKASKDAYLGPFDFCYAEHMDEIAECDKNWKMHNIMEIKNKRINFFY